MMKSKVTLMYILTLFVFSCKSQQSNSTMSKQNSSLLLCDTTTGMCEIPDTDTNTLHQELPTTDAPIKIIYYTDPICSSCWGIEPQLRKLKLEYGASIDIEYKMGGLLPDWSYNSGGISQPSDVAHHWDEVSQHYQMPIDGDVWLENPLHSSYPPSIAFKAAQLQGKQKAQRFLRKIREMVFLQKINIAKDEHLFSAAQQVGLSLDQFKTDYANKAKLDFQQDLNDSRSSGVRGFPTLFFSNGERKRVLLYGFRPYQYFEEAILKVHPNAEKNNYNKSWEALFKIYSTLTSKEYSELAEISIEKAKKELNNLFIQGKLQQIITKNGILWVLK